MERLVLGIDVGTSSIKSLAVNDRGKIIASASSPLTIQHAYPGYSEQNPDEWVSVTIETMNNVINNLKQNHSDFEINGISFSGQMHGLIVLDNEYKVIRPAILWNDTRSTAQCEMIKSRLGEIVLGNPVLEGFTLTKLMWLKQHEPAHWSKTKVFLLPKDYVRFKLTGAINMELSDASSTLLLDPSTNEWSEDVGRQFGITNIYPPLVTSDTQVGFLKQSIAEKLGISNKVAVFAGGGDNACGAIGAGVIEPNQSLCSIGTSGVILSCESKQDAEYGNNIHMFKHAVNNLSYAMGVTLSAGYSLNWFKNQCAQNDSFDELMSYAEQSKIGAQGLIFAPYLAGERTPHGDANIRGSFIGLSGMHSLGDMARAVVEGVTYSLYESIAYLRTQGKQINEVVAIGGGAKSEFWLQLQADIFNAKVYKLKHEEGPSMGAAMIAATGLKWYEDIGACVEQFIHKEQVFEPNKERHVAYQSYFEVYKAVYNQTQPLTKKLVELTKQSTHN
ncbi:xylulokinase [Staphylococcus sp. 18_1_E_LY]|uniref:Xylulose kinase n=1 Tax=Staphylococcus lloydii TaxID=2781774 RepID=A0A7T1B0J1_9STAP|nr:xylulokinase [Staphylococcus lloydii]MBF7020157.1 xylulokinase [Staphylococcus lloydii]MBF7027840.1 xylulokinase [Staphylococcus lloydii]QPM75513.1 xylulokinase [Staphylococcus lloydii]